MLFDELDKQLYDMNVDLGMAYDNNEKPTDLERQICSAVRMRLDTIDQTILAQERGWPDKDLDYAELHDRTLKLKPEIFRLIKEPNALAASRAWKTLLFNTEHRGPEGRNDVRYFYSFTDEQKIAIMRSSGWGMFG